MDRARRHNTYPSPKLPDIRTMLKPIDSATRETKSLDGLWRFSPNNDPTAQPWKSTLSSRMECPVPASYNDIFVQENLRHHIGFVWYQREVRVPKGWAGQRYFIRIDCATHSGLVYCNDKLVAQHTGGYMPFEADITEHVRPGDEARITIGVDNTLSHETIPPGEVLKNAVGTEKQKYWHDFFNYAGLARSVRLCAVPLTHVEDVTITTDYKETVGQVHYDTALSGSCDRIEVELFDEEGDRVGSASGKTGTIDIADIKLWQPGAAYLYKMRIRLWDKSTLLDEYSIPTGVRTVKVVGLEILINDTPFYFKGFGKHEDSPIKGKGHDNAWMVHDFELMQWCGANSFRTSHYPYAEEVMEYADRHGWVVIDETPAVGLNLSIGGGIFGAGEKRLTFSEDFAGRKTRDAHQDAIRELIQRDKNHPSVVLWCITNEPDSSGVGAREYFEPLVQYARKADPTRPITYTNVMFVKPEQDLIADLFDVIGLNRYYGWYEDNGDLATAEQRLEDELQRFQKIYNRPLLMLEYGSDTLAGLHSVTDLPWSEEYQASLYDMYHRVFDRIDAMQGEQVWNFADFSTSDGIFRVDGNKKGSFTRDRRPKGGAHALRQRWLTKKQ